MILGLKVVVTIFVELVVRISSNNSLFVNLMSYVVISDMLTAPIAPWDVTGN